MTTTNEMIKLIKEKYDAFANGIKYDFFDQHIKNFGKIRIKGEMTINEYDKSRCILNMMFRLHNSEHCHPVFLPK